MSFLEEVQALAGARGMSPSTMLGNGTESRAATMIRHMEEAAGLQPDKLQLGARYRRLAALRKLPRANLLLVTGFYKVETMRAYPHVTFVFGDNCQRVGKGGQAIVRDEPNVLGVATKKSGGEFFIDGDIADMGQMCEDLIAVESLLLAGRKVGIPLTDEGRISLGCGLAALPYHFPSAYAFLEAWLRRMTKKYPTSTLKL
jgi:hypothetical protein